MMKSPICCTLWLLPFTLAAQTITWDGGGDGRTWHDPLNWSGDFVPAASNHVAPCCREGYEEWKNESEN